MEQCYTKPVRPIIQKMRVQACTVGECPICGGMITPVASPTYCHFCGVAVDWQGE